MQPGGGRWRIGSGRELPERRQSGHHADRDDGDIDHRWPAAFRAAETGDDQGDRQHRRSDGAGHQGFGCAKVEKKSGRMDEAYDDEQEAEACGKAE